MNLLLMQAVIFLSAFLLFQVELIVAKMLLPQFGGAYFVWGAAVVFFQATLLAGYYYAHVVLRKFGIARYRYWHLALLCAPLLMVPAQGVAAAAGSAHLPMVVSIFIELARCIGLVFFVLSTTSIILQSWLAASDLAQKDNPYVLFGVSNLGSFVALLSYPFLIEPLFDLSAQWRLWWVAYAALALLHLVIVKQVQVGALATSPVLKAEPCRIPRRQIVQWFLASAAAVILFLSVTNIITYEVTPMPLLWIIPMGVYLLSFILNFKKDPWRPGWLQKYFYILLEASIVFFFISGRRYFPFSFVLCGLLFCLFGLCMVCQRTLYESKPEAGRGLTEFYLVMSLGGFCGGVFVSWVAPLAFFSTSMFEFIVGLACLVAALAVERKEVGIDSSGPRFIVYCLLLLGLLPRCLFEFKLPGFCVVLLLINLVFSRFKKAMYALLFIVTGILVCMPWYEFNWNVSKTVYTLRNYYGIYKVLDGAGVRFLNHGNTIHGMQYLDQARRRQPSGYYHRVSPVGEMLSSKLFSFKRIGVLGLGAGSLAAYARPNQEIDFFELDPGVASIARSRFTYLKDCRGKVAIVLGDGRLSLQRVSAERYDILILDVFTGDSVPTHLLTVEAFKEYKRCLSGQGVILLHISNRFTSLEPVIVTLARALGAQAAFKDGGYTIKGGVEALASTWALVTWDTQAHALAMARLGWKEHFQGQAGAGFPKPWTDEYTNMLQVLKFKSLFLDMDLLRAWSIDK